MIRKYVSILAWGVYFAFMAYAFFDGWIQWHLILMGLGFATAIHVWAFGFEYLEKRFDVGEARFDSETGKLIRDDADAT